MSSTPEFFDAILGTEDTGYIELKTDNFETSRWFAWPDDRKTIGTYCDMRKSEDVWFSSMLFSQKDRHAEYATTTSAVYMDADTCHPSNFRLTPSYSIQTSEGHWQCFWLLDRPYPADDVSHLGHKIAVAHKKQGCDQSGWITSKMMRVPGTTNTKYDIPYRVRYDDDNGHVYTMADMLEAYGDIDVERAKIVSNALPTRLPKITDALTDLPGDLLSLYEDDVQDGQSWSTRMWALLMGMFRAGFTREQAFVVARKARCNKYDPEHAGKQTQHGSIIPLRNDPDGTLWAEVLKAEQEYQNGAEVPDAHEYDDSDEQQDEVRQQRIRPEFLSQEERQLVQENHTFIDDYVDWVRSKSDSAERFQRSLAFLLLSCVYGDLAYISPQFGRMDLNLYMLILGPSTYGRKSTARAMFLRMLHEHERVTSSRIDIGSDFTGEGLNKELAERPNMVSLVHRDEFQGFIHEVYNKTYMTGVLEKLTELYDGRVNNTLRAGKDASMKTRVNVVFNLLGLGIANEISEVLSDKAFRSGFLARFVWAVIDEVGSITPDMVIVGQQETEYDSISRDEFIDDTIDYFQDRLVALNAGTGGRTKMLMSEMALERYNEWVLQVSGITDPTFRDVSEAVKPSTERLRYSVWKAAALLAVHDGSEKIEMHHVLHAIRQAELWYEDMTYMAGKIATTEYEREVQRVEQFFAESASGKRTKRAVYAKFSSHRPQFIEMWMDSLERRGVIRDDRTHYTYIRGTGEDA